MSKGWFFVSLIQHQQYRSDNRTRELDFFTIFGLLATTDELSEGGIASKEQLGINDWANCSQICELKFYYNDAVLQLTAKMVQFVVRWMLS